MSPRRIQWLNREEDKTAPQVTTPRGRERKEATSITTLKYFMSGKFSTTYFSWELLHHTWHISTEKVNTCSYLDVQNTIISKSCGVNKKDTLYNCINRGGQVSPLVVDNCGNLL